MSEKDMREAVIFCNDCDEEIIAISDYFNQPGIHETVNNPMIQQFEGHIDHRVSIVLRISIYSLKEFSHNNWVF